MVSPFLGGGSVELSCASDGIRVYGSDAFEPLATFWQELLHHPEMLADVAGKYLPMSREGFYEMQAEYRQNLVPVRRAAMFYVLNRCSFSGTTLSGGMSPGHPRFTQSSIKRLREFQCSNLSVKCLGYQVALDEHPGTFAYLDPPYDLGNGSRLYGKRGDMHEGFNHDELAEVLRERKGWVLSYNDCERIRRLYDGYRIITLDWKYGMSCDKKSKEVLIINE